MKRDDDVSWGRLGKIEKLFFVVMAVWALLFFTGMAQRLQTMAAVIAYFGQHAPLDSLAVASFGPVDFARRAIGKTPKLAWQDFPIVDTLTEALNVPVILETDVNAAAIGESLYGAGRGVGTFVYITVGTGIGGGAVIDGKTLHGLMHPEMGHLPLRRHPEEPADFRGACPFHGECLEGMASGPAMMARWGQPAETLPPGHPGWGIEAYYIAQACLSLACILSPHRIVVGGGVFSNAALYVLVNEELARLVQTGWFRDEAEAVRVALIEFVGHRAAELQDRFQRDDIEWALREKQNAQQ